MISDKLDSLKTLSAELDSSTEQLNQTIQYVNEELSDMSFSVFAMPYELTVNDKTYRVGFGKVGTKRQLVVCSDDEEVIPLLNASRIVRIHAALQMDAIVDALIATTESYIDDTRRACR